MIGGTVFRWRRSISHCSWVYDMGLTSFACVMGSREAFRSEAEREYPSMTETQPLAADEFLTLHCRADIIAIIGMPDEGIVSTLLTIHYTPQHSDLS